MSWAHVRLDEIAESVDYGHTASASDSVDGPKFLRITDIQDGEVDWSSVPRCECSDKAVAAFQLHEGDIVFARTGATTGKSFLLRHIPESAVFASYLIRVQPRQSMVYPGYLARFFETQDYWNQIARNSTGTAQGGVNASKLKALAVPLPPLPEQRRIAAILDKADALRAKRREAIAKLDQLLQSVFLDMFGDPLTNPKGWPLVPLAEAVNEGTIVTYGIVQAGPEIAGGIPYIRTGDIHNGEIRFADLKRTDPAIARKFQRSRVEAGDIVMSIRATVGTTALVPVELDGANLTQGTARIAVGKRTGGRYLLAHMRSTGTQSWIAQQIKGATFREITLARLRELPVMKPPYEMQQTFGRLAEKLVEIRQTSRLSAEKCEQLFAALQERAFAATL